MEPPDFFSPANALRLEIIREGARGGNPPSGVMNGQKPKIVIDFDQNLNKLFSCFELFVGVINENTLIL
jgi:hypothetical protein